MGQGYLGFYATGNESKTFYLDLPVFPQSRKPAESESDSGSGSGSGSHSSTAVLIDSSTRMDSNGMVSGTSGMPKRVSSPGSEVLSTLSPIPSPRGTSSERGRDSPSLSISKELRIYNMDHFNILGCCIFTRVRAQEKGEKLL